ncbi:hypothetical protein QCA50_013663 [Cerrena zonata]|uniref:Uncharacterized protein n=1 Tax=Cerrena zonata TaxID=2478898 RepID=A0AAW0G187_9APHY
MYSQYSPLFTSGFLSDSPSSSRAPSPLYLSHKDNHDSLPLTVNTRMSDIYAGAESSRTPEDVEALFLTFRPHRKQVEEGLSFLSLDLAESQSMRSMSLRRKDTVTTRATTAFGRSEPSSPSHLPISPIAKRSQFAPVLPPISPVSSLRRSSRETLLPSPKPAPSTSLPEPPASVAPTQHRKKPSNLTLTLSDCFAEAGPSSTTSVTSPFHRPSYSAPSVFSPLSPPLRSSPILSPNHERSYFTFSPTSPTVTSYQFPPPPCALSTAEPKPTAALKASLSMRSTATVNTRQRNRSAALAALEGRGHQKRRSRPRNFMSMSDDEDDDVDEEALEKDVQKKLLSVLDEEEDVVIPKRKTPSAKSTLVPNSKRNSVSASAKTSSSGSKRSRRSTIESFFSPLNNFIDLKDDEGSSLRWRSFVEFSA